MITWLNEGWLTDSYNQLAAAVENVLHYCITQLRIDRVNLTFILFAAVVLASIIGGMAGIAIWIIDTCGSENESKRP